jgi:ribose 1,5-bisphosphate isomerase
MEFKLPPEVVDIINGISSMQIRGASKIAEAGVRALSIVAENSKSGTPEEVFEELDYVAQKLLATRPTAVSLPNAIRYVMFEVYKAKESGLKAEEVKARAVDACREFLRRIREASIKIGEIGARRINDGDTIMTHCHSTAVLNVIKTAHKMGKNIKVIITETRPLYQGLITAEELEKNGIPFTLIIDSAARFLMKKVDKVIVGADAVAANGAVVNKIGTSIIALAAYEARALVFVAAETYKFSPETLAGELVKIEERGPEEVVPASVFKHWKYGSVRNPSFDVTPPEYIDLIITERGIIPPQAAFMIIRDELKDMPYEFQMRYSTYWEKSLEV